MNDTYNIIDQSPEIPADHKYYWQYQYRYGAEVLAPYLKRQRAFAPGDSVAEIGCAEGGVLAALNEAGAGHSLGTDIATSRLEMGRRIAGIAALDIEFAVHNIMTEPLPGPWRNAFDLAMLRDTIEHLDNTRLALANIRQMLKPGGRLLVTFPPYHSPYGGHQHTVASPGGKLPYIHLLPDAIFHKLIAKGRPNDIGEVRRLQSIRLTPRKFIAAAGEAGYSIEHSDYYLLRPVFKMKFGLPALRLTPLAFMPFVRKYLSLEALYILRSK
ncbi:MAG: class I SAM-dependent methyltransferase [Candidatus Kapaibacterium sp.]